MFFSVLMDMQVVFITPDFQPVYAVKVCFHKGFEKVFLSKKDCIDFNDYKNVILKVIPFTIFVFFTL